jgi:hypothetical protein
VQYKSRYQGTVLIMTDESGCMQTKLLGWMTKRVQAIWGVDSKMFTIYLGDFDQLLWPGIHLYQAALRFNQEISPFSKEDSQTTMDVVGCKAFMALRHFVLQSSIRINCPLLSRVVNTIRDQTVAYPVDDHAIEVLAERILTGPEAYKSFDSAMIVSPSVPLSHRLNALKVLEYGRQNKCPVIRFKKKITNTEWEGYTDEQLQKIFDAHPEEMYHYFIIGGMVKYFLKSNLATKKGLANGTEALGVKPIWDSSKSTRNESLVSNCPSNGVVDVDPPDALLFSVNGGVSDKWNDSRKEELYGEKRGLVYLTLSNHSKPLPIERNLIVNGRMLKVKTSEFCYTPAFAANDYKVQGLTLKQLILDLNESEGTVNKMKLNGLLVMLSRVKRIEDLAILPIHGMENVPEGPSRRLFVIKALQHLKKLKHDPELVHFRKGLRALSVEEGGCVWEYIPDESLTDSS